MSLLTGKIRLAVAIAFGLGITLWLALLTGYISKPHPVIPLQAATDVFQQIDGCVKSVSNPYEHLPVGDQALTYAQAGYINYVRDEYALLDYNIRHAEFSGQQFSTQVLLWMVVTITISGVLLDAMQLAAAYRITVLGRVSAPTGSQSLGGDSQLTIETGKLSLQTSVTGVLILAISLAFFIVYVKWVHPLQEAQLDRKDDTPASVAQKSQQPGGNLIPVQGTVAQVPTPQAQPAREGPKADTKPAKVEAR